MCQDKKNKKQKILLTKLKTVYLILRYIKMQADIQEVNMQLVDMKLELVSGLPTFCGRNKDNDSLGCKIPK